MKRKILSIAAIAALLPTPAQGHWQYTRWGMTEEQVLTASRGQAVRRSIRNPRQGMPTEEMVGTYLVAGRSFNLTFSFRRRALTAVSLSTELAEAWKLICEALTAIQ